MSQPVSTPAGTSSLSHLHVSFGQWRKMQKNIPRRCQNGRSFPKITQKIAIIPQKQRSINRKMPKKCPKIPPLLAGVWAIWYNDDV
jgi:hypothetical protein